jgi:lactate dehydrogenase-like 2-hydroxyacid dehydrogenase
MPAHILVTRRPPGIALAILQKAHDVELWSGRGAMPRDRLVAAAAEIDGLYCMLTDAIDADLLAVAPRLRVVSTMAVGVDNIDLAACTARRIPVGHTPGVLADTVADLGVGLLLAASRRIVEGVDYVRAGEWKMWEPDLLLGRDLHDSTVGIIGLGGVGRALARRLRGFGCRLLAFNRTPLQEIAADLRVDLVSLPYLLAECDHVIVSIALTAETHHLIDAEALRVMRPHATLINVSRGGTVDQKALEHALRVGEIAAAALDVTDPEPPAADDLLLSLPNCVVIPHLGSSTVRTRAAMAEMAARNLVAGLRGDALEACANPEALG